MMDKEVIKRLRERQKLWKEKNNPVNYQERVNQANRERWAKIGKENLKKRFNKISSNKV